MSPTLSLDLGTTTGWALWRAGEVISGTWLLATPKELRAQRKIGGERRGDIRFRRLRERIATAIAAYGIRQIVFEDVLFLSSQAQSQLWASLRAAVWCFDLPTDCVHAGTLKKFATGRGNADKAAMVAALGALPPPWGRVVADDNEADAVWVLRWADAHAASVPEAHQIRGSAATLSARNDHNSLGVFRPASNHMAHDENANRTDPNHPQNQSATGA